MLDVFEAYFAAIDGRPNTRGGTYHINLLPTTCHVYLVSVIQSAVKMDQVWTGGTLLNQKFTPQVLAGDEGLIVWCI